MQMNKTDLIKMVAEKANKPTKNESNSILTGEDIQLSFYS